MPVYYSNTTPIKLLSSRFSPSAPPSHKRMPSAMSHDFAALCAYASPDDTYESIGETYGTSRKTAAIRRPSFGTSYPSLSDLEIAPAVKHPGNSMYHHPQLLCIDSRLQHHYNTDNMMPSPASPLTPSHKRRREESPETRHLASPRPERRHPRLSIVVPTVEQQSTRYMRAPGSASFHREHHQAPLTPVSNSRRSLSRCNSPELGWSSGARSANGNFKDEVGYEYGCGPVPRHTRGMLHRERHDYQPRESGLATPYSQSPSASPRPTHSLSPRPRSSTNSMGRHRQTMSMANGTPLHKRLPRGGDRQQRSYVLDQPGSSEKRSALASRQIRANDKENHMPVQPLSRARAAALATPTETQYDLAIPRSYKVRRWRDEVNASSFRPVQDLSRHNRVASVDMSREYTCEDRPDFVPRIHRASSPPESVHSRDRDRFGRVRTFLPPSPIRAPRPFTPPQSPLRKPRIGVTGISRTTEKGKQRGLKVNVGKLELRICDERVRAGKHVPRKESKSIGRSVSLKFGKHMVQLGSRS